MKNKTKYDILLDRLVDDNYSIAVDIYVPSITNCPPHPLSVIKFTTLNANATTFDYLHGLNKESYTFDSKEDIFPLIIQVFKEKLYDDTTEYLVTVFDEIEFYHFRFYSFEARDEFNNLAQLFEDYHNGNVIVSNRYNNNFIDNRKRIIDDFSRYTYSHEDIIRELFSDDFESRIVLGLVKDEIKNSNIKSYVSVQIAYRGYSEFSGEQRYRNYRFDEDSDIFNALVDAIQPAVKDKRITIRSTTDNHRVYKFYGVDSPNIVRNIRKIIHKNYQDTINAVSNRMYKSVDNMFSKMSA